jgi:hypothetical protein
MRRTLLLFAAVAGIAFCMVRAYSTEPVSAAMSGRIAALDGRVSETVRCCWDSIAEVHYFAGTKGAGGPYQATVYDAGSIVAQSQVTGQGSDCSWVVFRTWPISGCFVKGKQYEVRVTRPNAVASDSLEYFYDLPPIWRTV